MYRTNTFLRLWAGLALAGVSVGCQPGPSPELQAKVDSLNAVVEERDQLVQEVAQNARFLSEVSNELAKVQLPPKVKIKSESPIAASRDTMLEKIRYATTRLDEVETRLSESRKRITGLTTLSDSLRATLDATVASYDTIIATQRQVIEELTQRANRLTEENYALRDTVDNLSTLENMVYYVIGTKDELKERGIIVEEGGSRVLFVLWKQGETLTPARELDPEQFVKINKRVVTEIPVEPTKEYQIVSRHDLGYLANGPADGARLAGIESLKIAAPMQFWANSKFLIVVERG
jgi:vacuolar-type H+-ATPase subunit I/STV1